MGREAEHLAAKCFNDELGRTRKFRTNYPLISTQFWTDPELWTIRIRPKFLENKNLICLKFYQKYWFFLNFTFWKIRSFQFEEFRIRIHLEWLGSATLQVPAVPSFRKANLTISIVESRHVPKLNSLFPRSDYLFILQSAAGSLILEGRYRSKMVLRICPPHCSAGFATFFPIPRELKE